jgi:hypothetical protein
MSDDLKNGKLADESDGGKLADDFKNGVLPDDAEPTYEGTTFPSGDGPKLTMPNGKQIVLCDIGYYPMFGACMFDAAEEDIPSDTVSVFSQARGQQMPGSPSTAVQRHHTNIYKSGESGLPRDYEHLVTSWWAGVSERLAEPVMALLDTTTARFEYNSKIYLEARLSDLVFGRVPVKVPIHMRDGLSYGVRLEPQRPDAWKRWREYMKEEKTAQPQDLSAVCSQLRRYTEMLDTQGFQTPVGTLMPKSSVAFLRDRLSDVVKQMERLDGGPGEVSYRKMTVWVYLGGYQKRVVV